MPNITSLPTDTSNLVIDYVGHSYLATLANTSRLFQHRCNNPKEFRKKLKHELHYEVSPEISDADVVKIYRRLLMLRTHSRPKYFQNYFEPIIALCPDFPPFYASTLPSGLDADTLKFYLEKSVEVFNINLLLWFADPANPDREKYQELIPKILRIYHLRIAAEAKQFRYLERVLNEPSLQSWLERNSKEKPRSDERIKTIFTVLVTHKQYRLAEQFVEQFGIWEHDYFYDLLKAEDHNFIKHMSDRRRAEIDQFDILFMALKYGHRDKIKLLITNLDHWVTPASGPDARLERLWALAPEGEFKEILKSMMLSTVVEASRSDVFIWAALHFHQLEEFCDAIDVWQNRVEEETTLARFIRNPIEQLKAWLIPAHCYPDLARAAMNGGYYDIAWALIYDVPIPNDYTKSYLEDVCKSLRTRCIDAAFVSQDLVQIEAALAPERFNPNPQRPDFLAPCSESEQLLLAINKEPYLGVLQYLLEEKRYRVTYEALEKAVQHKNLTVLRYLIEQFLAQAQLLSTEQQSTLIRAALQDFELSIVLYFCHDAPPSFRVKNLKPFFLAFNGKRDEPFSWLQRLFLLLKHQLIKTDSDVFDQVLCAWSKKEEESLLFKYLFDNELLFLSWLEQGSEAERHGKIDQVQIRFANALFDLSEKSTSDVKATLECWKCILSSPVLFNLFFRTKRKVSGIEFDYIGGTPDRLVKLYLQAPHASFLEPLFKAGVVQGVPLVISTETAYLVALRLQHQQDKQEVFVDLMSLKRRPMKRSLAYGIVEHGFAYLMAALHADRTLLLSSEKAALFEVVRGQLPIFLQKEFTRVYNELTNDRDLQLIVWQPRCSGMGLS